MTIPTLSGKVIYCGNTDAVVTPASNDQFRIQASSNASEIEIYILGA